MVMSASTDDQSVDEQLKKVDSSQKTSRQIDNMHLMRFIKTRLLGLFHLCLFLFQAFQDLQMKMVDTRQRLVMGERSRELIKMEKNKASLTKSELSNMPADTETFQSIGRMYAHLTILWILKISKYLKLRQLVVKACTKIPLFPFWNNFFPEQFSKPKVLKL